MPRRFDTSTAIMIACMLAGGVTTTILAKYQDMQCVKNCSNADPSKHQFFQQPLWQTIQMFIGEMGCWAVVACTFSKSYFTRQHKKDTSYTPAEQNDQKGAPMRGYRILLLALPACCDITSSTLLNTSLLYISASIYQMSRGTLVLWVGLFSIVFLKRTLGVQRWISLCIVVVGVAIVGLAGALWKDPIPQQDLAPTNKSEASKELSHVVQLLIGMSLIAGSQIFTASQFVLEEFILRKYTLQPLKVVGWEGIFGFSISATGAILLHLAFGQSTTHTSLDPVREWWELTKHKKVMTSAVAIMLATGCFNFAGIIVAQRVTATARSTIDCCRTLLVWIVSLSLHWESFKWLQVVGFSVLVCGIFLFSDFIRLPFIKCETAGWTSEDADAECAECAERLLPENQTPESRL